MAAAAWGPDNLNKAPEETLSNAAFIWASNSPVNGIPNIVRSGSIWRRFAWLAIFLGCSGFMIYQIQEVFVKYYSYPVDTILTYTYEKEVTFPSVTICNKNPIRKSMLVRASSELKDMLGPPPSKGGGGGISGPSGPLSGLSGPSAPSGGPSAPSGGVMGPSVVTTASPAGPKAAGPAAPAGPTAGPKAAATTVAGPTAAGPPVTGPTVAPGTAAYEETTVDSVTYTGAVKAGTTAAPAGGPTTAAGPDPLGRKKRGAVVAGTTSSYETTVSSVNATTAAVRRRKKPGEKNARFEMRKVFGHAWARMTMEDKMLVGHELDTLVVSCTYNGLTCTSDNFTQFNNHLYGNCYTFNSGWDGEDLLVTSSKAGPLYGLSLEMFIEQDEYIGDLSDSAGIRVQVHSQNVMPFPEDQGFNIAPGFVTSMALKRTEITRQPHPHPSKCVNMTREESKKYSAFSSVHNVNYTVTGCMKTCYQYHVLEACKCGDPSYPFELEFDVFKNLTDQLLDVDIKPCSNDTQDACMDEVKSQFAQDEIECNCPLSCADIHFPASMSFSKWPSKQYMATLWQTLAAEGDHLDNIINGKGGMDASPLDNLLKLEVYFEELNYEKIAEEPSYDIIALLSDLGGQLGFWVGMSVIAIFEVVELFLDLARILAVRMFVRKRPPRPLSREVKVKPVSNKDEYQPDQKKENGVLTPVYNYQPPSKYI